MNSFKESFLATVESSLNIPQPARSVTRNLIAAQDKERQRIAQEIHDGVGNRIALVAFLIREKIKEDQKRFHLPDDERKKALSELTAISNGLRDLSHFLYPASLHYVGIRAALKTLRDSMQKMYAIKIQLIIPPMVAKLPSDIELSIFRIAQESLQNIGRHSGVEKARIRLEVSAARIRLTVSDAGQGFSRREVSNKSGVGILCMEERALSVGGKLSLQSSPTSGTEVILTVPIQGNPLFGTADASV